MDLQRVQDFAGKVAVDLSVCNASVLTYVGDRLGLWAELARAGPLTPDELAGACRLDPRYVAEWLAAEAAHGYLAYDAGDGRFALPPEHAAVLADDDSPAAMAGGFEVVAGLWAGAERVQDRFTDGKGVAWGEQDERVLRGVARFFRPVYARSLVPQWLPAVAGLTERLDAGARVLDVGCGAGTSTFLMAQAFPRSTFLGLEPDPASVRWAEEAAAAQELTDRVSFRAAEAGADVGSGWDVVCFFDSFHHLGEPVAGARWARGLIADDGVALLVEPLAGDRTEENLTPVGTLFYSASTLLCLPDALSQGAEVALGGQTGAARIRSLLAEGGFGRCRTALETDLNLVIEARR